MTHEGRDEDGPAPARSSLGADAPRIRPSPLRSDAAGVTPLVGAILTLVLVIGAIAVVMLWGLPALHHQSARATLDAVTDQLRLMDDLTDRMADAGGGISGEAVFTYDRGGLALDPVGDRWVLVYGRGMRPADISLGGLADGDANYTVVNEAAAGDPVARLRELTVVHHRVDGDRLVRVGQAWPGTLEAGASTEVTFTNGTTGQPVPVEGTFLRLRFYEFGEDPDTLVAEAWVVDVGAVDYRLASPAGPFRVRLAQSALAVQAPGEHRVLGLDAVDRVQPAGGQGGPGDTIFVGFERLVPDASGRGAGAGSWGVKVRSATAATLTPSAVQAEHVRLTVPGPDAALWRTALLDAEPSFAAEGDGVHLAGPVKITVFYHEVRLVGGLSAR